jgi:hypothetical protein
MKRKSAPFAEPFFLYAAVGAAALIVRSLAMSRLHLYPIFDEVRYLDIARDFARRGGLSAIVPCYLKGACREDIRQPLYEALLTPFMRRAAADFAWAKLVSLAAVLFAGAAIARESARVGGRRAGALAAVLLGLPPIAAYLSCHVLADGLFAGFYVLAVFAAGRARDRARDWALAGALCGLAYLAKSDGHLLLLAALAVGLRRRGARFLARPSFYIAVAAFAAVASFLLIRNVRLWGNPFHTATSKVIWLDAEVDQHRLAWTPEWDKIGPAWYLARRGVGGAAARLASGLAPVAEAAALTSGVGPNRKLGCTATGLLLMTAAGFGLRRRWREGDADLAVAVAAPGAVILLLLAWFAQSGAPHVRYVFPVVASLWPFAAAELARALEKIPEGLRRRAATAAPAAAAAVMLLWLLPQAAPPLSLAQEPASWAGPSAWLNRHGDASGFLVSYQSPFSQWDSAPDLSRPYDFSAPAAELRAFCAAKGLHIAVIDPAVPVPDAADKFGPSDAEGPTSFLGWPRCYRGEPGGYLIFAAACPRDP